VEKAATEDGRPSVIGGTLAIIGGALVAVSSFVNWGEPQVVSGRLNVLIQVRGGTLAILGGAILIFLGLLLLFGKSRGLQFTAAVLAVIVGVMLLYVSGSFLVSDDNFRSQWVSGCIHELPAGQRCRLSQEDMEKELDRAIEAGDARFDPNRGTGLYLAVAGGALGIAAGIAGLVRRKPKQPTTAVPVSEPVVAAPPEDEPELEPQPDAQPAPEAVVPSEPEAEPEPEPARPKGEPTSS
jgi:hypothetical protein